MEEKQPDENKGGATPDGNGENGPPKDALANPEAAANAASMAIDAASSPGGGSDGKPAKKLSPVKKLTRHVNVYFILFVVVVLIGAAIAGVAYFNSKKTTPAPTATSGSL